MAVQVKEPNALVAIVLLLLLFLGGGVFGVFLADTFAPGSFLAQFVGLFMLPLSFIIGMQFWLGLAIFIAIGLLLRWFLFGKKLERKEDEAVVPSGSFVFVPVSLFFTTTAGLVTGLVPSSIGFFKTLFTYITVGFLYGMITWRLARSGKLPLPHE